MSFPDHLFSAAWVHAAWVLYLLLLSRAVRTAPWRLLGDGVRGNVWWGALVVLTLFWSLKAGVKPGLSLHLLGATALTLMFGRALAIVGLSLVLAAVTLNAGLHGGDMAAGWQAFPLGALLLAVVPAFISQWVLRGAERFLPANLFVFFFVGAFFGAWLTVMATGLLSAALLWLAGIYGSELLLSEYLPFYLLLGFAEGWLNGACITLMVVYVPRWVASFDDRRYLWNQKTTE